MRWGLLRVRLSGEIAQDMKRCGERCQISPEISVKAWVCEWILKFWSQFHYAYLRPIEELSHGIWRA